MRLTSGVHTVWVRAQTGSSAWGPYALHQGAGRQRRSRGHQPRPVELARERHPRSTTRTSTSRRRSTSAPRAAATSARLLASGSAPPRTPTPTRPASRRSSPCGRSAPTGRVSSRPVRPRSPGQHIASPHQGHLHPLGAGSGRAGHVGQGGGHPARRRPRRSGHHDGPARPDDHQRSGRAARPSRRSVIVTATVADSAAGPTSDITSVEGYVGAVGPGLGRGEQPLLLADRWRQVERRTAAGLARRHGRTAPCTVFVVGTDAAGNRSDGTGTDESKTITLDQAGPPDRQPRTGDRCVPGSPATAARSTSRRRSRDATSGIAFAEYFVGADPGQGTGHGLAEPDAALRGYGERLGDDDPVRAVDVTFTSSLGDGADHGPLPRRGRELVAEDGAPGDQRIPACSLTGSTHRYASGRRPAKPWNTVPVGAARIADRGSHRRPAQPVGGHRSRRLLHGEPA